MDASIIEEIKGEKLDKVARGVPVRKHKVHGVSN